MDGTNGGGWPLGGSNEIEVEGLVREFKGGIRAVDGVLGPNGAGKSTTVHVPEGGRRLLPRLLWAGVGFGVMLTGFALALSVFLIFIGVPLFVLGLAIIQSQAP